MEELCNSPPLRLGKGRKRTSPPPKQHCWLVLRPTLKEVLESMWQDLNHLLMELCLLRDTSTKSTFVVLTLNVIVLKYSDLLNPKFSIELCYSLLNTWYNNINDNFPDFTELVPSSNCPFFHFFNQLLLDVSLKCGQLVI